MDTVYFYLWFILDITLVTGQSTVYVLRGREAVLAPALNNPPDDILWKHNGDKVISFDGAEERVFEPYRGRVTLAWDTAKLTISDVRYEDSGEYELDIISGERFSRSQYLLKVLDKVSKPVIRCEMNSSSNIISATLFCSSPSNTSEALTFVWTLEGKSEPGQTLPIELDNGHDGITYRCTANNLLQEETSTFMATDCYTERTSEPQNIVVPVVIAFLILLAVVVCILFIIFRHRKKRVCLNMRKNDDCEEEQKAAVQKPDESHHIKEACEPLIPVTELSQPPPPDTDEPGSTEQSHDPVNHEDQLNDSQIFISSPGNVQELLKKFENCYNTETLTGKGHDTGGKATSPPTSPSSSFPKPVLGPRQMDSGGEMDLQHEELHNVPTTEEDEDTDFTYFDPDEYENDAVEIPESPSPSHEPQIHQEIESFLEEGSSVQTEPEKEPDKDHKDKDDEQKMEAARPSNSIETGPDESTNAPEEIVTELSQPPPPDTDEPGSTEQTIPVKMGPLSNDPVNHEDQLNDSQILRSSPGNIQELLKQFENCQNAETFTSKGKKIGGKATSSPTSVGSRVPKPTPGPGQMDSGAEMDLQHTELNNVSTTEEDGDTDSTHSDEEINRRSENEEHAEHKQPERREDKS